MPPRTKFTFDQALAEARTRWGDRGVVQVTFTGYTLDEKVSYEYAVGQAESQHAWNVLGQGPSWEVAFANAGGAQLRLRPRKEPP